MSRGLFYAVDGIRYYRVNAKNRRAYWTPTRRMRQIGFGVIALGPDSPEARREAEAWTEKWLAERPSPPRRAVADKPKSQRSGARPELRQGLSFIYFLQVGDCIKIGVSRAPFARVRDIAGGAHGQLTKAVIIPGTRCDEQLLHARFARYRINGEWFAASRAITFMISRCAATGRIEHEAVENTPRPVESNHDQNSSAFSIGVESNHSSEKRC